MPALVNHPALGDLDRLPLGDIAALPADQLALLQDEAETALTAAKATADRIAVALTIRYAERAQTARRTENKDTGTVRFDDGPVTVVADLPKKIDWDQPTLAAVVERIRTAGDDPAEYVDITFKVPERKYAAWPESIRAAFETARTVRTGKPSIRLSLNNEV
ncbi:MAG: hypothetical protein RBS99_00120 [Rhodospirillales bacterium]|jgi:hypothetical protein|nr:hypothetical protein [Rhodospirillales bacterium]